MMTEDELPGTSGHFWTERLDCQNGNCSSTWWKNRDRPRVCNFASYRPAPHMTGQLKRDLELHSRHGDSDDSFTKVAAEMGMNRHEAYAAYQRARRYHKTMAARI